MANIQNLSRKGRKPGARNRKTIAREMATAAVMAALTEKLTPEEIAALTPVQIMSMVMISEFKSGNYLNAANVAEKLAPYMHPRVASTSPETQIPADLLSECDPVPQPDEDVPANVIL